MEYEPQEACPKCGEPMDGVGWLTTCEKGWGCTNVAHWIGPAASCRIHGEPNPDELYALPGYDID